MAASVITNTGGFKSANEGIGATTIGSSGNSEAFGFQHLETTHVAGGGGPSGGLAEATVPDLLGDQELGKPFKLPEPKGEEEETPEGEGGEDNEGGLGHVNTDEEIAGYKANGIHGPSAAANFGQAAAHRAGMTAFGLSYTRPPGGHQPTGLGWPT